MTRTTTGHSTRALRGLAVLLIAWIGYRVPALVADFEAMVAPHALAAPPARPAGTLLPMAENATPLPRVAAPRRQVRNIAAASRRIRAGHRVHDENPVQPGRVSPIANDGVVLDRTPVVAVTTPPVADLPRTAGDLATLAYARLAAGDRRAAVRGFDAALAAGTDPLAAAWRAERAGLTLRAAGGASATHRGVVASGYGEGGIVGDTAYAAAQGRVALSVVATSRLKLAPGVGAWASVQRGDGRTVDRVDLGPGISARIAPFELAVDYRVRVAGNAAPGNGVVVTMSTNF